MADIACVFHWPPSEMFPMSIAELLTWREKAARRNGAEDE